MAPNNKAIIPLLMTLIMLFSIGLMPSEDWNEKMVEESEINQNKIDYSLIEQNELSEFNQTQYALSQTRNFAVLRVAFPDEPNMRFNLAQTQSMFTNISTFFNEATYGGAQLSFAVLPTNGTPLMPINRTSSGDQILNKTSYEPFTGCGKVNRSDLMSDTIIAGIQAGIDFTRYDGVILLHVGWNNGCSGGPNGWAIVTPSDLDGDGDFEAYSRASGLVRDTSMTWVGERSDHVTAVWGRIAHEVGHAVGLPHLSYSYAHCHDVMGSSCAYPVLPSSWSRALESNPGLQSMDPSTEFTTVGTGISTYSLADLNEDPTSLPSGFNDQVLKIPISSDGSLYYLVESRFATFSDTEKPIPSEGVMIYRVNEWSGYNPENDLVWEDTNLGDAVSVIDSSPSNTLSNAAWSAGQTFQDPSYGLTIEVLSVDTSGHSADVRVTYNPTGAGPADIHISDWGQPPGEPGPYETIDIWVDSRLNNNDIDGVDNDGDGICDVNCDKDWDGMSADGSTYAQVYSDSVNAHPEFPLGRGDTPWIGHENRFYVKISNTGETTLGSGMVKVKFQWKKPTAGGGVSEGWTDIGLIVCGDDQGSIDQQTGTGKCLEYNPFPDESIETNELVATKSIIAYIEWTPEETDFPDDSDIDASTNQTHNVHSCIRVVVEPIGDEPTIVNNDAQENLNYFETSTGSPYHSLMGSITIGNPFNDSVEGYLLVSGLPSDWTSNLSWEDGWLAAGQSITIDWSVTPDEYHPLGTLQDIDYSLVVFKDDDDAMYSDHGHEYILGGVTTRIATVERTVVNTVAVATPGFINVVGDLDPYNPNSDARIFDTDSRVAIIVTSPNGIDYVVGTPTNSVGEFNININLLGLADSSIVFGGGEWMVQVHYDGDSMHRSAFGEKNNVQVPPLSSDVSIIDPIYTPTVSWGDDYLGGGTLIYPIYPGTDIAVTYTSPSGDVINSSTSVDSSGSYSNTFSMNESGTWIVDYSYTDNNGVERSWSESVDVEKESTGIPSVGLLTTISIIMFSAIIAIRRWD